MTPSLPATNMLEELWYFCYVWMSLHHLRGPACECMWQTERHKWKTLTFYCCEREDVRPADLMIMTRQNGDKQRWQLSLDVIDKKAACSLLNIFRFICQSLGISEQLWINVKRTFLFSFCFAYLAYFGVFELIQYRFFHFLVLIGFFWFKDIISNLRPLRLRMHRAKRL